VEATLHGHTTELCEKLEEDREKLEVQVTLCSQIEEMERENTKAEAILCVQLELKLEEREQVEATIRGHITEL